MKPHSTFKKGRKVFFIACYSPITLIMLWFLSSFFGSSIASLKCDLLPSEIILSPNHDSCKLLKVNKKIPLVSPHF
ncbi:hypothetical protein AL525_001765 [Citrobacter amalonaticus]|nr:hypothetical protein AL525_001765 [Citrobacter amalonaticus]